MYLVVTLVFSNSNFNLISTPIKKNPVFSHLNHQPILKTYKRRSLPHTLFFYSELHGAVFPIHEFLAVSYLSIPKAENLTYEILQKWKILHSLNQDPQHSPLVLIITNVVVFQYNKRIGAPHEGLPQGFGSGKNHYNRPLSSALCLLWDISLRLLLLQFQ